MDKKSDTGRKLKIFAATVAAVLLAGFFVVHHLKSREQGDLEGSTSKSASTRPIVSVILVKNSPSSIPLTLPGETAAWYESIIYARVDGYVAKWNSDIGDHVQKGQILATIETPELDAELAAAQAKLKASQAVVVARQADSEFAKTTYQRWKESPKGVVSEQEREGKKAGFDSAVAHVNEAKAQTGLDQAHVERYIAMTQFKQVRAPYAGTITRRRIDIGNLVTSGSNANTTPLYTMVQDDPIRVFVDVPQSAAADIVIGTPVQVIASNISNRVFEGKVVRTACSINSQSRTMRCEIDMPNPDHALVAGMYVNATFQVPTSGLVQIPAAALVNRSGVPQVATVDKDEKVNFHNVTIVRDNGKVLDVGSGVSAGDKVILNAGSQIIENGIVEAREFKDDSTNATAKKH
jgi:RND family efflux transporter MFP subunit